MNTTFYVCGHRGCRVPFAAGAPGVYVQPDHLAREVGQAGAMIIRCANHAGDEAVAANEGRGLADQAAATLLARPHQQ